MIPGRERAHETGATAEMQIVVVGEKVLDAQEALLEKLGTDETVVIGPKAAAGMAELNGIKRPAGADPDPTLPPAGILSPTPPEVQMRDSPDHPPGTWTEEQPAGPPAPTRGSSVGGARLPAVTPRTAASSTTPPPRFPVPDASKDSTSLRRAGSLHRRQLLRQKIRR